jgi:hypothetical protein
MINKNIIKLKRILLAESEEGWNIRKLDVDTFKKYITTDFSESWNQYLKGNIIYRGERNIENNISYVIPGSRYSQNTSNHYTELFSEILPSWKDFPKRNHSVICTTDYNKSNNYGGKVYVILPKNGTKIGVCSESDIWYSFPLFNNEIHSDDMNLSFFAHTISCIVDKLYGFGKDIFMESFMKFFLEDFKNHKKIDITSRISLVTDCYELLYENKDNLFEFFNYVFDPYKNGFKLLTINDELPGNKEVWFDNNYIAIKENIMNKIVKKIGNLND